MRVLWINGSILPDYAEIFHKKQSGGTWLIKLSHQLQKQVEEVERLTIIFSVTEKELESYQFINGIHYYGIFGENKAESYSEMFSAKIEIILLKEKPDIIHIWGTENEYSYCSFKAIESVGMIDKTVISIQGLVSIYAQHFYAGLPQNVIKRYTLMDLKIGKNLVKMQKEFVKRGKYEIYELQHCKQVIGRTEWDLACCKQINSNVSYYACNETLRDFFYCHEWNLEQCQRHSVFISQTHYQIKGFHFLLEALRIVRQRYPDVHIYATGNDRTKGGIKDRMKFRSYDLYLHNYIYQYELENNITFVGRLNEQEMCQRYLKSHVFVSPSSIENSSNAIGEAMILGVPVIASSVGGIQTLLEHGVEGYLYQADAAYMLAHYIMKIFEDDNLACNLSKAEIARARQTHDPEKNKARILHIYRDIILKCKTTFDNDANAAFDDFYDNCLRIDNGIYLNRKEIL